MVKLTAGHSMSSGDSRRVWAIVAICLFWVNYDSRIVPLRLHYGNECNDTGCGRFTPKSVFAGRCGSASPARVVGVVNEDSTFDSRRPCGDAELTSLRLPSLMLSVLQSAHEPGKTRPEPTVNYIQGGPNHGRIRFHRLLRLSLTLRVQRCHVVGESTREY